VDSEPATIAVNIWWEGVRSVVDDNGALSQRSDSTTHLHVAAATPASTPGNCTGNDDFGTLPLCYLGRLCLARQVEQMKKQLLRRAALQDRELLRSCNCTCEPLWPVATSEPLSSSVGSYGQPKQQATTPDRQQRTATQEKQVEVALHWLLACDGTTQCTESVGSECSEDRRQKVLAFIRCCPVRLQMAVLLQLASDHPKEWQLIFRWVCADPMTAYALTSAWESQNENDSGSIAVNATTTDSTEMTQSVDGSNVAMVEFFSPHWLMSRSYRE